MHFCHQKIRWIHGTKLESNLVPIWILNKRPASASASALSLFLNKRVSVTFMFFQWVLSNIHKTRKTSFFSKTFIKNGLHGTIHTFKNYFAIMFSVFSKISSIQTHPFYLNEFGLFNFYTQ